MIINSLVWMLLIICVIAALLFSRHMACFIQVMKIPGAFSEFFKGIGYLISEIYPRNKKMKYHPGVYFLQQFLEKSVTYKKYGMYCFWAGINPIITIFKPELVELVLGKRTSTEKAFDYNLLHSWLRTGLLTSDGQKWKQRRKLLTPCFHFRILENSFQVFNEQSSVLIEKIKPLLDRKYIDIKPLIERYTLAVNCEAMMGVSIEAQQTENSDYPQTLQKVGDFLNVRITQPWFWPEFIFASTNTGKKFKSKIVMLHNFTEKMIKERKMLLTNMKSVESDTTNENGHRTKQNKILLDRLLEEHLNGIHLCESDIKEEVDTFMFEGHDTTAMATIYALYCIGLHPQVQEKIKEELDIIFGSDIVEPATYDDIKKMKYLECVLKEAHRLFPAIPIIGRNISEDILYEGIIIPKNTTVRCDIMSLHRNPDVFTNPEVFDPERFLPENSAGRHPYAFIPFSAGPRNCIGQKFAMLEEKTIVSNILRHFRVTSLDPMDEFRLRISLTLRPAQEVRMKFTPRF